MSTNSNQSSSNEDIIKRLDAIISLLLNLNTISEFNQLEKIKYLTKLSFSNDEIAIILSTSKGTIEAQKYKKPKGK